MRPRPLLLAAACAAAAATACVDASTPWVPTGGDPPRSPDARGDMVWIPGGTFRMGSEDGPDDARPVHEVRLDGFWMDRSEVTNDEFARFVEETGYETVAERPPPPGIAGPDAAPGSLVFARPDGDVPRDEWWRWWRWKEGASWRHPAGPGSSIDGKGDHPVVHVAWEDAARYAQWAGKRLPTEAELEYAALGGLADATFPWGDEPLGGGAWRANVWQGRFPLEDEGLDGWTGTAPVDAFPPNGYGLLGMAGNVWEWCADWYRPDAYAHHDPVNPKGPSVPFDPDEPDIPKRVMRGGSYLCNAVYCEGYRVSARMRSSPDTGLPHVGFRCVADG